MATSRAKKTPVKDSPEKDTSVMNPSNLTHALNKLANAKFLVPAPKEDSIKGEDNLEKPEPKFVEAKIKKEKIRVWAMETVQSRDVIRRLNLLSLAHATIFSVNQAIHIGGSYEVIYYNEVEKPV